MAFFTSIDDLKILEAEVKRKLLRIRNRDGAFQHFPLRAGIFRPHPLGLHGPLHLHGPHRLLRNQHYLPTIDAIAHFLTLEYDDSDHFQAAGIGDIILLPELVLSETALLSHIYLPAEGILACYLHPSRLNRPRQPDLAERFTKGVNVKPGLLRAVIDSLPAMTVLEEGSDISIVHKFILAREDITDEEIQAMEDIDLFYSSLFHYESI